VALSISTTLSMTVVQALGWARTRGSHIYQPDIRNRYTQNLSPMETRTEMAPARASTRPASPSTGRSPRRRSVTELATSHPDTTARRDRIPRKGGSPSPKYSLAAQINRLLDAHRMGQISAAQRLGISQSKVSAIRNYKLHGISLERLLQALVALDQRVAIVVKPRGAAAADVVSVIL
jgi:predicted XRE-type DNA-binding protein